MCSSLPFSAKQQCEIKPTSASSEERERRRLILLISIWNWTLSLHIELERTEQIYTIANSLVKKKFSFDLASSSPSLLKCTPPSDYLVKNNSNGKLFLKLTPRHLRVTFRIQFASLWRQLTFSPVFFSSLSFEKNEGKTVGSDVGYIFTTMIYGPVSL